MFTIWKSYRFEAAHHLGGLPPEHQCGRVHGHSYRVTLELSSTVRREPGFVVDFGDLRPFKAFIDDHLDHRDLNQVVPDEPTSENLAVWLFSKARDVLGDKGAYLTAVRVQETETSCAEYRP